MSEPSVTQSLIARLRGLSKEQRSSWWRSLTDAQRWELFANCCWNCHEINWFFSLPDEQLAALPLVSTHREPQIAPQEYDCGCVTVTRITDGYVNKGARPFEMRLAYRCGSTECEVVYAG